MNYEQFKATSTGDLKTSLQKQEIEVDVSEHYIEKLNDSYSALSVTPKGGSIDVNTSLDEVFHAMEGGGDYNEVLFGVTESPKGNFEHMLKLQVSGPINYAEVKSKLAMEIVSTERNAGILQNVPYEQMEDIAAVYRLVLDSSKDTSSAVPVTNDLMDKFGIIHEQLHNDAMKNAPLIRPAEIKGIEGTLNEMQGGPILEPDPDEILSVAGVPDQSHGTAVIVYPDFFKDAAEKLGGDYSIIPSGIHEVFLVKDAGEMNARDLATMIKEVSATEVVPEGALTDHVYHYDSKKHAFGSTDKFGKRQTEMEATGPEGDRGSLVSQLNTKKEGAVREAPKKAVKDTIRKSRGSKAL